MKNSAATLANFCHTSVHPHFATGAGVAAVGEVAVELYRGLVREDEVDVEAAEDGA